jgi:N-acetylglucosaminyldiphosphoundecaprenol N-acetyl-beta-D-mannosaminyltransferase
LDTLPIGQVEQEVCRAVEANHQVLHCSLNALKVVEARKDARTRELLEQFDLITPDGMSVVWGLRILGKGKCEQVAGVDLMARLLKEGARRQWGFFLLGAKPEVVDSLRGRIEHAFPGTKVAGVQHGFFSRTEESHIVRKIRESGAHILFVGMPSPRKEQFLIDHKKALGVPFAMGVGGGLDLLAGKTRRAPRWMRRSGLEWLYRVIQEPRRLAGRYLVTNLRFAGILALEMLSHRRSRGEVSC